MPEETRKTCETRGNVRGKRGNMQGIAAYGDF